MTCGHNYEEIRPAHTEVLEEIYVKTTIPTIVYAMTVCATSKYNRFQKAHSRDVHDCKRKGKHAETYFCAWSHNQMKDSDSKD